MDSDELVWVYLHAIDTGWWPMGWDRRDVLLVWMWFWGWYTRWGLIPYPSCCCFVVDQ